MTAEVITRKVEIDSAHAQDVLGINDENLRVLDNLIDADFHARGHVVKVTGPDHEVARAVKVLEELESIARRGHVISPDSVKHAVSIVTVEAPQSVAEVLASDIVSRRGRTIRPKTLGQKEYVAAIDD